MKRILSLDHSPPTCLAALSILGSLLCPLSFGILYLSRRCGVDYSLIATAIVCLILGFVLSTKASTQLTEDIRNQRWTSTELQGLRTAMQHPVWSYLTAALLMGQVAPFVFISHHAVVGQCLLIPALTIIRVRTALRPPTDRPTAAPHWTKDLRPIHSDHWGER
jgi:uncharacterized membrane protein